MSDGMTDVERAEQKEADKLRFAMEHAISPGAASGPSQAPQDPWKHRSAHMKCVTCMWFVAKSPTSCLGRCRRHAPTMSGYPAVYTSDWCGDHKMDERAA